MGVNAGAFLGIMLCGYLGEILGWSWGFGLAGIFMLLGLLQFLFAQNIFGEVGKKPNKEDKTIETDDHSKIEDKLNPFTFLDKILIIIVAAAGLTWVINDPLSKIGDFNLLSFGGSDYSNETIIVTLILFLYLLVSRILRYSPITRDKMVAVVIFAFFIIFFWASFEQAGGSMSIFAKDYTSRILSGNSALLFNIVDVIITVVPVAIITWVLFLFFKQTFKKYFISNLILGFSFVLIWGLIVWKINNNFNTFSYEITYPAYQVTTSNGAIKSFSITAETLVPKNAQLIEKSTVIRSATEYIENDKLPIIDIDKKGVNFKPLSAEQAEAITTNISATVKRKKENEIEIPATWFLILNSLFIIAFAPLFSKWWESKYNPNPASKYAIGLFFLAIGFAFLAYGATGIPQGAKTASVSIVWLILAYLFHTLGELCVSPVGLSYVSKLVPPRMIAFMFGVWYLALAIGNKTSGKMGSMIDDITNKYDIATFFLIFTFVPIGIGVIALILTPVLKKLMHGVK
jgi:POT family proton-dependent oligopeptide transporter